MSEFSFNSSGLEKGLNTFFGKSGRAQAALLAYAEASAIKLQNYSRDRAPWTDRTGHARQRLTCTTSTVVNGYKLTLAHGVDYGVWLELAHEKRFAIIQPTILANSNEIMSGLNKLLERLG